MPIRSWLKSVFTRGRHSVRSNGRPRRACISTSNLSQIESLESRQLMSINAVAPEYPVNSPTTLGTIAPKVAMDAAGDYVVVWEQTDFANNVNDFGQRYNANGVAQGSQFQINSPAQIHGGTPNVAMDRAGDFVVTWVGYAAGILDGAGVYARRYNASGQAQGNAFLVSSFTTAHILYSAVAMDAAGDFTVAWNTYNYGLGTIDARQYLASGAAAGNRFCVNPTQNGGINESLKPSIAMDSAGDFVITWDDNLYYGEDTRIYGQRFTSNGAFAGQPFLITDRPGFDASPSVAMDAAGDFVVTWGTGSRYDNRWTSEQQIDAQRYDASGNPEGTIFRVDQPMDGGNYPQVAFDPTGNFIIMWTSLNLNSFETPPADFQPGVFAQRYDATGTAQDAPFQIGSRPDYRGTGIAMDAGGNNVAASQPANFGVQGQSIFARNFTFTFSNPQLTIAGPPSPLNFVEGSPATDILASLSVGNSNFAGQILTGATIQITGNYHPGQDRISFSNTAPVQWSWNSDTGTLTLTGRASAANYQQMLRSVTYQNVSNNPNTLPRTITFHTFAGNAASNALTQTINVVAVNNPPVISGIESTPLSYTENSKPAVVSPSLLVADADSVNLNGATIKISAGYKIRQDVLSFVNTDKIKGTWDAKTGTLTLAGVDTCSDYRTALRSISFLSKRSTPGDRTITFQTSDGSAMSNMASRIVSVIK